MKNTLTFKTITFETIANLVNKLYIYGIGYPIYALI